MLFSLITPLEVLDKMNSMSWQEKNFRDQWSLQLSIAQHLTVSKSRELAYEGPLNLLFSARSVTELEIDETNVQDDLDLLFF
jgi:hypothetical protein